VPRLEEDAYDPPSSYRTNGDYDIAFTKRGPFSLSRLEGPFSHG